MTTTIVLVATGRVLAVLEEAPTITEEALITPTCEYPLHVIGDYELVEGAPPGAPGRYAYADGEFVHSLGADVLAQERAEMVERIKTFRDYVADTGGYKVVVAGVDKWFHADTRSKIQQMGLTIMGASVPPVPWKTMDGTYVSMSQSLAGQIFAAAAGKDIAVFNVAKTHLDAVAASLDPLSYDFSGGWPAIFQG